MEHRKVVLLPLLLALLLQLSVVGSEWAGLEDIDKWAKVRNCDCFTTDVPVSISTHVSDVILMRLSSGTLPSWALAC